MEQVDSPAFFPGCCALCKGAGGPMLDTEHFSTIDERIYVCSSCTEQIVQAAGGCTRDERQRLLLAAAERDSALGELEEVRDELVRLQNAVRTTLARGGVADGDGFKLRPKPGEKAVSV